MAGIDLLIISPAFHGYDRAIGAAFRELGLTVREVRSDPATDGWGKVRLKALHELPERLGRDTLDARRRWATRGVRSAVRDLRPRRVLVIKGDLLADELWEDLSDAGVPTVLWLYDELRRTRWEPERLDRPDAIASYSRLDVEDLRARGIPAQHVALGHDHLLEVRSTPSVDEVTFVGARYPARERFLESLWAAGVPVRAYGRSWSHDPRDRLRTWGGRRPDIPNHRDVPRDEAYAVMRAGTATLNLHGDQDGFTMRTFEAAGVGAVQICDRDDVAEHYEPGREVLVARSAEEAVDLCGRARREAAWAAGLRRAAADRTLAEHTLVHRARELSALW